MIMYRRVQLSRLHNAFHTSHHTELQLLHRCWLLSLVCCPASGHRVPAATLPLPPQSQLSDLFFSTLMVFNSINHLRRVTHLSACDGDSTYLQTSHPKCATLTSGFPCHANTASTLLYVMANFGTVLGCITPGEMWSVVILVISAAWVLMASLSSNYGAAAGMRELFSLIMTMSTKGIIVTCLLMVSTASSNTVCPHTCFTYSHQVGACPGR